MYYHTATVFYVVGSLTYPEKKTKQKTFIRDVYYPSLPKTDFPCDDVRRSSAIFAVSRHYESTPGTNQLHFNRVSDLDLDAVC